MRTAIHLLLHRRPMAPRSLHMFCPSTNITTAASSGKHTASFWCPSVKPRVCLFCRADTQRDSRGVSSGAVSVRRGLAVRGVGIETYGRRAFSVAGPTARNSLPDFIRAPTSSTDCLGVYLKRTCLRVTSASSALAVLGDYALYKSTHSLTHCLETWIPTDTPPHSFASCPSASPQFLSPRQLFNQWSERREGTSPRRSCSRRRRPRSSHGGSGGGGGGGGFSAND